MVQRETYNLAEVAKILGIGINQCYELARQGKLPVLRLGARRMVVPRSALVKLLESSSGSADR